MRVLFVQPDMTFKKSHPLVFKGFAATIPLGLAYMAAYLEKGGHKVDILDYQIGDYDISAEIKRLKPDILGISICSPAVPHAFNIAKAARLVSPKLTIVAGGAHISAYGERILKDCSAIDILVIGEGELTILELTNKIEKGDVIKDIKGIVYRSEDEFISTGNRPLINDLSQLPMMPLHLFDLNKYYPLPGTFKRLPSLAMSTSRGCPFKCTFCNSKGIWGNSVRMRPAKAVVDEIEYVVNTYNVKEIYFVDELFTMKRSNVVTFCEELIKREIKIGWKCCSRVDTVDRELLQLMKRSGCFLISFGVESGDDKILGVMKKGISADKVRETFKIGKEVGIQRMAFFILNSYGETRETIQKTISLSKEIKPDFVNFELFKPFPGIEMRKLIEDDSACKINWKIWDDWDEFTVGNRIFYTQNDVDELYLKQVYEKAIKGFYFNPFFILKSLIHMRSYQQFKSYFKTFLNMLTVKVLEN